MKNVIKSSDLFLLHPLFAGVPKPIESVGTIAIKVSGSMGKVTISFDNKKTYLQAIWTAVSDLGLGVE